MSTADALEILRQAVGLPAASPPRHVFIDAATDLAGLHRGDTRVAEGLDLGPLAADAEVALTGILLGQLREFG